MDALLEVGLIGAGLQGERRTNSLRNAKNAKLVLVADADITRARRVAASAACEATNNWRDLLRHPEINLVLVCTPNSSHAEISVAAMKAGKNVLCEKPLARTVREAEMMVATSRQYSVALQCGFNLRYHPAVMQALKWKAEGRIGRPMFIRCVYGICGREGYEKDWRMNKETAGGGQLMDQGMHVLDLCRLFGGDYIQVKGWTSTLYWRVAVEDNAFALMKTREGTIATFHVSWTEWKNLFSFEVFGSEGAAVIRGLGGSYGDESICYLNRPAGSEPFSETRIDFRGEDTSWRDELEDFVTFLTSGDKTRICDGSEGLRALQIAEAIYESSSTGRTVELE